MKLTNLISRLSIVIVVVLSLSLQSGCITEKEHDACDDSVATEKVVNIIAIVHIEDTNGTPVDSANINVNITYLPCGSDSAAPNLYDNSITDISGNYTSNNANIVMKNTEDRIMVTAIAPNIDFYQQNFDTKYYKYSELSGTGQEEVELVIYQNAR